MHLQGFELRTVQSTAESIPTTLFWLRFSLRFTVYTSRTAGADYLKGISPVNTKVGLLHNRLSIPCDGKDVLSSAFSLALDGVQPRAQWLTDAVFHGAKTTGPETDHSPLSSDEVR